MTDRQNRAPFSERLYRYSVIFLAACLIIFLISCFVAVKTLKGRETAIKYACSILSVAFFSLAALSLLALVLCWFAAKLTQRANLMISTPVLAVACIGLALNIKWIFAVFSYGFGDSENVTSQIGTGVASYFDFLDGVKLRVLFFGFAAAIIITLGAVSFFHLRRDKKLSASAQSKTTRRKVK